MPLWSIGFQAKNSRHPCSTSTIFSKILPERKCAIDLKRWKSDSAKSGCKPDVVATSLHRIPPASVAFFWKYEAWYYLAGTTHGLCLLLLGIFLLKLCTFNCSQYNSKFITLWYKFEVENTLVIPPNTEHHLCFEAFALYQWLCRLPGTYHGFLSVLLDIRKKWSPETIKSFCMTILSIIKDGSINRNVFSNTIRTQFITLGWMERLSKFETSYCWSKLRGFPLEYYGLPYLTEWGTIW